ncbi:SMP-30/gluconolactonase/LRE family protein [Acuticoccus sp. MNP-M23]|uniref:SMP-30/gluconolactonase/LRE family protein n=1 Tax=Acuticoccus sp. MNP-M23 TaxID=3072793 RepID=UPI002815137E|nr:SMP-30/gluconolactonase/LRE family protein [Acuticoccus sp. MNP-M23]WMS43661.1 SMP-30/gluconolactonase/LRE family protein [Acuticoccus sp. MNP-M23]
MSVTDHTAPVSSVKFCAEGLVRPECVLAHRSGLLFAADWTGTGGVTVIDPQSGHIRRHLAKGMTLKPNGIWLEPGGTFLLAHLGDSDGGVFRLWPDGQVDPVLTAVDGVPLPPTNFVAVDSAGRLYVTVSTRHSPRHLAARPDVADGFIVMLPPGGDARIVADGLGYTNECLFSADGRTLFVNETFARQTTAFHVAADGSLADPVVYARYGDGIYPDGMALDTAGGLVVVAIISNTVVRVTGEGAETLLLADRDEARVSAVNAAYASASLTRALLDAPHAGPLQNVSSIAFGGADMRTAYLGCLLGDRIASFGAPFPGVAPPHYDVDLSPLAAAGLIGGSIAKGFHL